VAFHSHKFDNTAKWRRRPESAVRTYLTVMDRNPEAVEKALMNKS
jgi:hypothetical protein